MGAAGGTSAEAAQLSVLCDVVILSYAVVVVGGGESGEC